jgi:transposase
VYDPDVVLGVDTWTCRQWGVGHERDPNGAINLEKLGLAEAESTRGHGTSTGMLVHTGKCCG